MSVVVARNALHHGDGRALSSSLLAGTASIVRQTELNEEDSRCEGLPSRDQISLVHLPVSACIDYNYMGNIIIIYGACNIDCYLPCCLSVMNYVPI